MSFSPNDIAYFLEVVKQGHIGRAAEAVGVTQPAISKALRRLEDAVGMPLVERGSHGVRPTASGRLFLDSAQRFHLQHQEMARTASEIRAQHAGLLRLGLTNAASDSESLRALSQMLRNRPGLRATLSIGKSDDLNAAVERGDLDAAVVPSYPGHAFSAMHTVIGEDTTQIVARAQHPIFQRAHPTLSDLQPYAWILANRHSAARQLIAGIFEREGVPAPQAAVEVDYTSEAVMGLVAGTDLLSLVPRTVLRHWMGRVTPVPVPALTIRRSLVLLARPQARWSPLMTAFRDQLLAHRTDEPS